MEIVASLSQGRTAAAQCGLFTYKSVPVIFEPPCVYIYIYIYIYIHTYIHICVCVYVCMCVCVQAYTHNLHTYTLASFASLWKEDNCFEVIKF